MVDKADLALEADSIRALDQLEAKVSCIKSVSYKRGSHRLPEKPEELEGAATQLLEMKQLTENDNKWLMIKKWQDKLKSKWNFKPEREDLNNSSNCWLALRTRRLT